jgi:thiol-disulfide isomerase/thioredoxin
MKKRVAIAVLLASLAVLVAGFARGAEKPLDKEDVLLLLLGGASSEKMITLIQQRGISFRMDPDLAKKFHDAGASDEVIEALQRAGAKVAAGAANEPSSPPSSALPSPAPAASPGQRPAASEQPTIPASARSGTAAASEEPSEPRAAPLFSLVDLSGQKLSLADYKGKVVVLIFWATWCPRCREFLPALIGMQDRYRDKGLQVLGLSVDKSASVVRQFQREHLVMNFPVAMADRGLANTYGGISGIPTTFMIGRDGKIYGTMVGAPADPSHYEQRVKAFLAYESGEGGRRLALAEETSEASPTTAAVSTAPSAPPVPAAAPTGEPVPPAKPAKGPPLTDPPPDKIDGIIREFAAKEELFKEARNNYTYHQINKVQEMGPDGDVVEGTYEQDWDILFDDNGKRIEKVTYAPVPTLQRLGITAEDLEGMRSIQPFVLTTSELPDYDIKYLGHVRVDELTAYVFSIRPKEIKKGRLYFQGTVWVDDRDLQIVKSEGKQVPEARPKHGQENLFPRFSTYREQIDGKYWFPTYTMADDTLYFAAGPVRVKQVIRYTDYKQFKARVRIITTAPVDQPNVPPPKP